jgi:mRNA interferase RelE/StbE
VAYRIEIDKEATTALGELPAKTRRQIAGKVDELGKNPFPAGVVRLEGAPNLLRIRSEDYRIIYTVDESRPTVFVLHIAHRKEVYDYLRRFR